MKQKYKVFINDQEIVFLHKSAILTDQSKVLPASLTHDEIYSFVKNSGIQTGLIWILPSVNPEKSFLDFTGNFHLIKAAGGIVRNKEISDSILMIFRLGKWDSPKGKTDPGEQPEAAAIREVEEECGVSKLKIEGKAEDTWHLYEHKGKVVIKHTHWYHMSTNDTSVPVPQTDEGIDEVKWVKKKELSVLLPQSYASICDLLQNEILNH